MIYQTLYLHPRTFGVFQALESEATKVKFHDVYTKLILAIDALPTDELGLTDEVKEQVHLNLSIRFFVSPSSIFRARRWKITS